MLVTTCQAKNHPLRLGSEDYMLLSSCSSHSFEFLAIGTASLSKVIQDYMQSNRDSHGNRNPYSVGNEVHSRKQLQKREDISL